MANYCYILLDASGSMSGQIESVRKSVGDYIDEIKAATDGDVVVDITQFDGNRFQTIQSLDEYSCGGLTPLYDSIGKTLKKAKQASKKKDRVTVVIETDGAENASTDLSFDAVSEKVQKAKDRGWNVIFLGSGLVKAHGIGVAAQGHAMGAKTVSTNFASRGSTYEALANDTKLFYASGVVRSAASLQAEIDKKSTGA